MPGRLRLVTLCLLLSGLAVTVVLLADGRASQEAAKPAVEEPIPVIPNTRGPSLTGPVLVVPGSAYASNAAEEEADGSAAEEPTIEEAVVEEPAIEQPATKTPEEESASLDEDTTEEADETADSRSSQEEAEPAKPLRQLSPEMAALRDRVRRTIATYYRQTFNTRQNTSTDVMNLCLAFGCNSQVYRSDVRQKVNGITCLCWNYPCAGYTSLTVCGDHIAGKIGYGTQTHPSQLLAVLALSRVPADYPVRVGEDVRTVADLVEGEKATCRSGSDMSLKLIGLAYYVTEPDATWKNDQGEEWSLERIVKEELDSEVDAASAAGTKRLMGLGYAVQRRILREQPIEGEYQRAKAFIDKYVDFALQLQNPDGSWGPNFLATRGTSRNQTAALRSTGHILGWLVVSLPEENLADPRIARAVNYVNRVLGSRTYQANLNGGGQHRMETIMHALHGLTEYDRRWFQPADPPPEPKTPEAKPEAGQQASR